MKTIRFREKNYKRTVSGIFSSSISTKTILFKVTVSKYKEFITTISFRIINRREIVKSNGKRIFYDRLLYHKVSVLQKFRMPTKSDFRKYLKYGVDLVMSHYISVVPT